MSRLSLPARIGILLIVAGLLAIPIARHWFSTRMFVPLDQPLSLENGSVSKAQFTINSPAWYLNSEPVTPEELPANLRSRLGRGPSWVVYVDGDSSIEFADVAQAIDIIRAEHAQVILLTDRSRQEIESKAEEKPLDLAAFSVNCSRL